MSLKNQKKIVRLNKMDPNMLSGEMFNNPDMMKSMQEMMKNPDIMCNAMKMMGDPNMRNLFSGLGGLATTDASESTEGEHIQAEEVDDDDDHDQDQDQDQDQDDDDDDHDDDDDDFSINEEICISGLKKNTYNNKRGVIKTYNPVTLRYQVYVEEIDKTISIKPENITKKDTTVSDVS